MLKKGVTDKLSPIAFSGHLDVVPLSSKKWNKTPFKGEIKDWTNFNSVPDHAESTIDVRTTKKLSNADAFQILKGKLGEEVTLEPFVDLNACYTNGEKYFCSDGL